jgi:murein DD-endopeptidase MepM/ murein hydrolase activator NlpD
MRAPPLVLFLAVAGAMPLGAQASAPLPPLPDSSGWGVDVLAARQDRAGGVWVGTYGDGIYYLAPEARSWRHIVSDTSGQSISWDFVHAFGFGPRGEVWYGTVGNGWGVSTDTGRTWRNWTFGQLGPEFQYVAPDGIVTLGDTTIVATADGLQVTTDDGAHWTAIVDSTGPAARGPADTSLVLLGNEYVLGIARASRGRVVFTTLRGGFELKDSAGTWHVTRAEVRPPTEPGLVFLHRRSYVRSHCGLHRSGTVWSCVPASAQRAPLAAAPQEPRTTWFGRPIATADNPLIDQTYRYGSTMGGNFQQHQGVEFNNPDGTPVHAVGSGTVVYAGPAERGALTVAIRMDSVLHAPDGDRTIFTVYYHNSSLVVQVGDRVAQGEVISHVGHTGRATNDHVHLEVHAAVIDSVPLIVDSLERYPRYTTNPELWIAPPEGTGIVAGQVWDSTGKPVPGARIYGLSKREPRETPLSYVETYRDRAHSHPLYGEHFAIGGIPPGSYVLGTEIDGRKVWRRVTVAAGKLTWVEFR